MQNNIRKKNIQSHFFLIGLCFILLLSSQEVLRAQTYSSEEIVISGLGFTRFAVALEPQPAFSEHPEALAGKESLIGIFAGAVLSK